MLDEFEADFFLIITGVFCFGNWEMVQKEEEEVERESVFSSFFGVM